MKVKHPKCELMGRNRVAQVIGGMEGERIVGSVGEDHDLLCLALVMGGYSGAWRANLGDLLLEQAETMRFAAESRKHKATGLGTEVRVVHTTRSMGEPCTWGRDNRFREQRMS